jgi:hypothetical protein
MEIEYPVYSQGKIEQIGTNIFQRSNFHLFTDNIRPKLIQEEETVDYIDFHDNYYNI